LYRAPRACDHDGLSPIILVLLTPYVGGDMNAAAHDLARTVAATVERAPVALSVRNLSTLDSAAAAEIRRIFEAELTVTGQPAADVQLTVSENLTQFLLVADIHRGAERQVLLDSWPRTPTIAPAAAMDKSPRVTLEKKLLWEQDLPILDAAQTGDALLLLDATRVFLIRGAERHSATIPATHAWPRDLRGRLSLTTSMGNAAFTAWLPGTICQGNSQPQLSLVCRDSQDPWLLAPSAIALFAPDRNLFQGHIDTEPGGARDLPPFYSAAPAGDAWIFAAADGRAHVYTHTWELSGAIDRWGSDVAAIQTTCGVRILATRPTSLTEPDAIQPYEFEPSGAVHPAGPALEFTGPITALWSAGSSATAVSRDLQTGRYAAYSLAPICGS
jgi:hypothetical protein